MHTTTLLHPELCFKACSDPTRLRILLLLQEQNELCVCQLTEALQVPQAKMSRHLAYLRKTGLVADRKDGQWVHYRLIRPKTKTQAAFFDALLTSTQKGAALDKQTTTDRKRLKQACQTGGPNCC